VSAPDSASALEYEREKLRADKASLRDVAEYLGGLHDFSEPRHQPWLARAQEALHRLEGLEE